jgi:hypothetical protein
MILLWCLFRSDYIMSPMDLNHYLSPTDVNKIENTFFQLNSTRSLREYAVTKIVTSDTIDDEGYPITLGLMDPHMGVIDSELKCKTCGKRFGKDKCMGHFGYIDLAEKVFHPDYHKRLKQILSLYCFECGSPLIGSGFLDRQKKLLRSKCNDKDREDVIEKVIKLSKKVQKCPNCEYPSRRIKLKKPIATFNNSKICPMDIECFLEKIHKSDYFDFDPSQHLEWMILSVIPVVSVHMRPYYFDEDDYLVEDGLTLKYQNLVKVNQHLSDLIKFGAPELIVEHEWGQLQNRVDQLFRSLHYRVDISKKRFVHVQWPSFILNGLHSSRPEVRGLAAIISGYVDFAGRDQIIKSLIETVWDRNADVQVAAIRSLMYLKSKEAVEPLKKLFNDVTNIKVHVELVHFFNCIDEDLIIPLDVSDNESKKASLELLQKVKSMSAEGIQRIFQQMEKKRYEGISDDAIYEKMFHHLLYCSRKELEIEKISQDISLNIQKMDRLTDLFIDGEIVDTDYVEMMEILKEENRQKSV